MQTFVWSKPLLSFRILLSPQNVPLCFFLGNLCPYFPSPPKINHLDFLSWSWISIIGKQVSQQDSSLGCRGAETLLKAMSLWGNCIWHNYSWVECWRWLKSALPRQALGMGEIGFWEACCRRSPWVSGSRRMQKGLSFRERLHTYLNNICLKIHEWVATHSVKLSVRVFSCFCAWNDRKTCAE